MELTKNEREKRNKYYRKYRKDNIEKVKFNELTYRRRTPLKQSAKCLSIIFKMVLSGQDKTDKRMFKKWVKLGEYWRQQYLFQLKTEE